VRPLLQHHSGLAHFSTRQMWTQAQQMSPASRRVDATEEVSS
jgi:hypothetical protein